MKCEYELLKIMLKGDANGVREEDRRLGRTMGIKTEDGDGDGGGSGAGQMPGPVLGRG